MAQGVVNVVMGNAPEIGDAILASPQVLSCCFKYISPFKNGI